MATQSGSTGRLGQTATRAGNFRVFTRALAEAGLKESLQEKGPYTIFAPTDQAFAKVPKAKLDDLLKPENKETLQLLLRNHIVLGKLMASELMRLDKTKTARGEDANISSTKTMNPAQSKIIFCHLTGVMESSRLTSSISGGVRQCFDV